MLYPAMYLLPEEEQVLHIILKTLLNNEYYAILLNLNNPSKKSIFYTKGFLVQKGHKNKLDYHFHLFVV